MNDVQVVKTLQTEYYLYENTPHIFLWKVLILLFHLPYDVVQVTLTQILHNDAK